MMKIARIVVAAFVVLLIILLMDILPANEKEGSLNESKEENAVDESSKTVPVRASVETSDMQHQLDEYIKSEPHLKGALIGISIRSAVTGKVIYQHNGDTRMHPASNMKLITAASALSTLGKDYTFSTEVLTDGAVVGDTLLGNLYIKGKGDPTLLPEDFNDFAKKISEQGIKKIDGNIIGDDTWYDDVRISPNLIWDDEQYYYGAQISALTASSSTDYDAGSVIIDVTPGADGEKPSVTIYPHTNYMQVVNKAKTVSANQEEDLEIGRKHGTNIITIEGAIPSDSPEIKEWMAVWEPTKYALDLFKQALKSHGISWTGEAIVGQANEDANVLFTHESMPLSELLVPLMKLSNNVIAEVLVKEMGKVVKDEGSWEKGLAVVEEQLLNFGLNIETLKIRDGSGISSVTLLPPNEISKLLYAVQKQDWYSTYIQSLPVAGADERMVGGTLRNRMEEISNRVKIQAKTGTIHSVSSLSGYLNTQESETVIFSILINHLLDEDDGKNIEDKIVTILANM